MMSRGSTAWIIYPATLVGAFAAYATLSAFGASVFLSAYLPVAVAAAWIAIAERRWPHRPGWRPTTSAVKEDLLFVAWVQILLPQALALATVLALTGARSTGIADAGIGWPHGLPVAAQAVLMLLIADFFRYWLHRAAHRVSALWRLHAVHHSPAVLYWLNTARFHPLEKALQFTVDSLPFVLLGVTEPVFAAYFVFYAINGFFQHSNIELRFGWLNYVVSSAELHRWHHSRIPAESNRNFGNNVILWDLLFGTWYLPRQRQVRHLGLINRCYPTGFRNQMLAPFTPDITHREVPLMTGRQLLRRAALRLIGLVVGSRYWRPFQRRLRNPGRAQARLLKRLIEVNAESQFGRERGFARIRTYADFKRRVPIQTYETLRPYIDRQRYTGVPALTAEAPVMYGRTSGTTDAPKLIPVLGSTLKQYREQQKLFLYRQYRTCPEAFAGKGLSIVSPAVEEHLETGQPCGSVSGHIYQCSPRLLRTNSVVPAEVFQITDYDLKYRLILRFALTEPNITYLAGANPTSFLRLLEVLSEHKQALIESLADGGFDAFDGVPREIRRRLATRMTPNPLRAAQLKAVLQKHDVSFTDLWPGIRLLATWTSGSCGLALGALRKKLPPDITITDLGFLATEFRATLPVDGAARGGLPLVTDHFYEFSERHSWDAGNRETVTIKDVLPDCEYYLIVTAQNGLYRYFINDIVRVTDMRRGVPLLEFVQKGKGTTNITGEKLCEDQVIRAVSSATESLPCEAAFFMMLADEITRRYELLVETAYHNLDSLGRLIDKKLAELNIEYRAKRLSGRLGPLKISILRSGAAEAYKRFCVNNGQRESQFKTLLLQWKKDVVFPFHLYKESPA